MRFGCGFCPSIKTEPVNIYFKLIMKKIKLLVVALFAMALSVPTMAQGTSLSTPDMKGGKERVGNFEKACLECGPYMEFQSVEAAFMKLVSVGTLGGYTLRCEQVKDMTSGKKAQAIKITPNSNTGIGKIVSGATGLGREAQTFYVDVDELPLIFAQVEKMTTACQTEPAINTTYSYVTRGGFAFSMGYVVNAKKAVKLGQIGQTGEIPFADFSKEMVTALKTAQEKLSMLK